MRRNRGAVCLRKMQRLPKRNAEKKGLYELKGGVEIGRSKRKKTVNQGQL
jgi:hypothetical protein